MVEAAVVGTMIGPADAAEEEAVAVAGREEADVGRLLLLLAWLLLAFFLS